MPKYSWLKERVPDPIHQELIDTVWHEVSARLQAGNVHVLLEGDRFRVAELLNSLNAKPIVLTSRPAAYHGFSLADMDVYQLQRLQLPQIKGLAKKICAAFAPKFLMDKHQQPLETVLNAAKGQGKYVASNPLLLSFMCLAAIRRTRKDTPSVFPSHPTPLIKECIDTLVVWHREHKIGKRWPKHVRTEHVIRVLSTLALKTFRSGVRKFTEKDLKAVLPGF